MTVSEFEQWWRLARREQPARRTGLLADAIARRQEELHLIRILRDETQSRAVYDRCVAIVGEKS